jgi:hypothetical protein
MKKLLLMLAAFAFGTATYAQNKPVEIKEAAIYSDTGKWNNTLELGINFNQSTFSPNWSGGGVNSYAIGGLLNGYTSYTKKRFAFDGKLSSQYGIQNTKGQDLRKTIDVLLIDTKIAYLFKNHKWSTYLGANLITQFTPGYEYDDDTLYVERKSNFFAPAYITIPLGFQYKPNQYFFARFGVASLRYTIVTDKQVRKTVPTNYGVDTNKIFLQQFGMQIVAGYNRDLTSTINLKANYFGFFDYEKINVSDFVHRLDLTVSAKVTKYINTTFSAILLYDRSQDKDIQLSQVLNVGFLVKLGKN